MQRTSQVQEERTVTTILVVEDHPIFVQSLTRLLRERGHYEVLTAGSGEQALARLKENEADLAVIDLSLPGRSGLWLIGALHELKPEFPCVVLSGFSSEAYVKQALDAGARGYVLKDDIPGILEGIDAALHGRTFTSEALGES